MAYRPRPVTPNLGEIFYDEVAPARFPQHTLRWQNVRVAERLGLSSASTEDWIDHFARFVPLPENLATPLALRYHGHQFRQYNAALGDGRGFLYAQLLDDRDRLIDLSTKGSGQTPWSRGGDGRLTLKGGVREVLAAEMLAALGVTTSSALSLVETGDRLQRNDEPSPTRGSVLVRAVWSSVRLGTFQRLAHEDAPLGLKKLVAFCCENYFPTLHSPEELFAEIVQRSARLVGQWLAAGFVHGVLNSDNLNITGESFDYGPWRFLPRYDPRFIAAYFDQNGLYAYGRQSEAVRWNLGQLAQALVPIASRPVLEHALVDYDVRVLSELSAKILWRLNLEPRDPPSDALLVQQIFCTMRDLELDWDRFFFDWEAGEIGDVATPDPIYAQPRFVALRQLWADRNPARQRAPFRTSHPATTMRIEEVERIWSAIDERDDWTPFHAHIDAVRKLGAHLLS